MMSPSELKRAEILYKQKRQRVKQASTVEFLLSLEEYIKLIDDANISPFDIGNTRGSYHLGRKNEQTGITDQGNYEVGNCRFIPMEQNNVEAHKGKVVSQKTRDKMSKTRKGRKNSKSHNENIKKSYENRPLIKCPHCPMENVSAAAMSRWHFDNCKHRGEK